MRMMLKLSKTISANSPITYPHFQASFIKYLNTNIWPKEISSNIAKQIFDPKKLHFKKKAKFKYQMRRRLHLQLEKSWLSLFFWSKTNCKKMIGRKTKSYFPDREKWIISGNQDKTFSINHIQKYLWFCFLRCTFCWGGELSETWSVNFAQFQAWTYSLFSCFQITWYWTFIFHVAFALIL